MIPQDMTPSELDTMLVQLHRRAGDLRVERKDIYGKIHEAVGDKLDTSSLSWRMRDGQALIQLFSVDPKSDLPKDLYRNSHDVRRVKSEIDAYQAEFLRRGGWPQFFTVKSTAGHTHSSIDCRTCRPKTRFFLRPELSGMTEEEALATDVKRFCRLCFPKSKVL